MLADVLAHDISDDTSGDQSANNSERERGRGHIQASTADVRNGLETFAQNMAYFSLQLLIFAAGVMEIW